MLGVPPSTVLFATEARLSRQTLDGYKVKWDAQLDGLQVAGQLHDEPQDAAGAGVRGKRADETRAAVQKLQAEGWAKMQIVRQLGIGRTTSLDGSYSLVISLMGEGGSLPFAAVRLLLIL